MKAQAQRTAVDLGPAEQPTPVIIKIGSGSGPMVPGDSNLIILESDGVPFEDTTGDTWHEAFLTLTGRIDSLLIRDGDQQPLFCEIDPEPDKLVSLELTFKTVNGDELFIVEEVKEGRLRVQSPSVAFQAKEPTDGRWFESQATFLTNPVKAVFAQRRIGTETDALKFEYLFNSSVIFVNLNFEVEV